MFLVNVDAVIIGAVITGCSDHSSSGRNEELSSVLQKNTLSEYFIAQTQDLCFGRQHRVTYN